MTVKNTMLEYKKKKYIYKTALDYQMSAVYRMSNFQFASSCVSFTTYTFKILRTAQGK